jgi:hypothetical protein
MTGRVALRKVAGGDVVLQPVLELLVKPGGEVGFLAGQVVFF